jgi:uncharacterized protein (DUF1697 family)
LRQVVLLRGINLGPNNRIAMPALREALADAGHANVRTYVQSGNVVLDSELSPDELADGCRELIAQRFGLEIPVVVRTADELAGVVERNPLKDVAENPKRYQVSFLSCEPAPEVIERLERLAGPSERLVHVGRELYAWHPEGVARSKLWAALAARGGLGGVVATARNWTTVTTLREMASADAA